MNYQTSSKIVSRVINDELIVIQLDTGRYHYFSNETQELLESFKDGMSIDAFIATHELDQAKKEELQKICDTLLERKIFQKCPTASKDSKVRRKIRTIPRFLRDGERTLDQISFASP